MLGVSGMDGGYVLRIFVVRLVCVLSAVCGGISFAADGTGALATGDKAPDFPFPLVTWENGVRNVIDGWQMQDVAQRRNLVFVFVGRVGSVGLLDSMKPIRKRRPVFELTSSTVVFVCLSQEQQTLDFREKHHVEEEMLWDPHGEIYRAYGVPLERDLHALGMPVVVVDIGGTVGPSTLAFDPTQDLRPMLNRFRETLARREGHNSYDAYAAAHTDDKRVVQDYRLVREQRASAVWLEEQRIAKVERENRRIAAEKMASRLAELEAKRLATAPASRIETGDLAPNFYVPDVTFESKTELIKTQSLYGQLEEGNVLLCFSRDGHYSTLREYLIAFDGANRFMWQTRTKFVLVAPIEKAVALDFKRLVRSEGAVAWDPERRIAKNYKVDTFRKRTRERHVVLVGQDRRVHYTNSIFSPERDLQDLKEAMTRLSSGS
jgi:peroxiredoxin